ncbi:MAG TPA: lysylphosphatidylglycerol synthase transmembrane domain-containing protein, partial [Blastocatellia bacterium]
KHVRDKAYVLTTLLYDRFVGLFTLLIFGLGAALASRRYLPAGALTHLIELILVSSVLVSVFLLSQSLSDRLSRLVLYIGRLVRAQRIAGAAARGLNAMSEVRSHKSIIVSTLVISAVSRLAWTLGFYVIALAMDLPVSLALLFAFISIVDLIRQLPVTPNGLGLREGALVLLLGELGIAKEQALMFSFLSFAPLLLCAIAGGIIYITRSRVQTEE